MINRIILKLSIEIEKEKKAPLNAYWRIRVINEK